MISEIDTSSVVDETESTKVTTESQMAECSTELMRRPETIDGRWIPARMQECLAGVTLTNVGCECDDQAGQQHEPADPDMVLDRRPLGAVLHSSNEPGELSQWLCHDDIDIVLVIIIIIIIINCV